MNKIILTSKRFSVYDILPALSPILMGIERANHVRVVDYVETIVRNYIEYDFTMHFHLSRQVAYYLIDRFGVSTIFTSLQCMYISNEVLYL